MMTGYTHPTYAESLSEFGTPRELLHCGGWILVRQIPEFSFCDAMGCYPIFTCQDWAQLGSDFKTLENELVSLSLVTDPFGRYDRKYLDRCFKSVVIPFKEHFVIDLTKQREKYVSEHHRRYARKALLLTQVGICERPTDFIDEWMEVYEELIVRHNIKGIPSFSRKAFVKQLNVPGIVMFLAKYEETTIGILLWYIQGEVGYYHLGASSSLGYKLHSSFALFWYSLEYFASIGLRWLDIGAGAGTKDKSKDGLSEFKRGWSTGARSVYFCGHVFDHDEYEKILKAKDIAVTDYFPAYRKGEFV
jgi:hypothetical protein